MKTLFPLALVVALGLLAQSEQASLTGTVKDPTGAVVPQARVVVVNQNTGVAHQTVANASGSYLVPFLHPGGYAVTVSADGFKTARVSGVSLSVGLTATVDVTLEVGVVQHEVTVSSSAVQLEQQSASLGTVVGSNQMVELPLLGRDPYNLVLLAPGVLPTGGGGGVNPIVNGGRTNTSAALLDGAESRASSSGGIMYTPPLEAVQEFNLFTNGSSSMFGRSGGGVLTVATRSGTNEVHGSFYEFVRNTRLNANGWTNNRVGLARSAFHRNEYGASIGGPIYVPRLYNGRNRTFFFFNWELIPERTPANLRDTVPTDLERRGDFSQTFTRTGQLIAVFDPLTTGSDPNRPGRFVRSQFPGNRIPSSRLDPIAQKVLTYLPLPNRGERSDNFVLNRAEKLDTWRMFLRLDHSLSDKHRLFWTFGRHGRSGDTPSVNIAYPGEGTNAQNGMLKDDAFLTVLSETAVFRPNLFGEFKASVARWRSDQTPRSLGFDVTQLGFSQELGSQISTPMFPEFIIADSAGLGPGRASYRANIEQNQAAQAHLTWLRGKHSVRAGFDFTFFVLNLTRPNYPSGTYNFSRTFTQGPDPLVAGDTAGNGIATFLLGLPTGGQISKDPSLAASQKAYAWYVHDDWKILPQLTLNLGLRWEYQTPWTDRFDQLAFFDSSVRDPLTRSTGVLRFAGRDGAPRLLSDPDRNNYSPRVGIAWTANPKTVVRAGYGIFYVAGSGGIGGSPNALGDGFLSSTPVFLGPPPASPNTPPAGASLARPFISGFLPVPTTGVGAGLSTQFRDWVTPFNQQWNFNIQRTFGANLLVETAYVGSRGQRIWVNRDQNAVGTEFLALGPDLDRLVPNPFFGIVQTGTLSARTVRQSQLLRPFPHYANITRIRDPIGDSVYHGFTLRVDRRIAGGFRFQVAYTVSKMIDNIQERFGGRSTFFNPNNLGLSRSVADFDRSQFAAVNFTYELPLGTRKRWLKSGVAAHVLGNWQVSGITFCGTGVPLAIAAPNTSQLPGVGGLALRLKSAGLPEEQRSLDRWFDTTAFRAAAPYSLGNDSRTQPSLRGPGMRTFNLSAGRRQRIGERIALQFRAEFFNAFNKPQFNPPNTNVNAIDFGRIQAAGEPRVVQLGLRLTY